MSAAINQVRDELARLQQEVERCKQKHKDCEQQVLQNAVIQGKRRAGQKWYCPKEYPEHSQEYNLLKTSIHRLRKLSEAKQAVTAFRKSVQAVFEHDGTPPSTDAPTIGYDIANILNTHAMCTRAGWYISDEPFVFGPASNPIQIVPSDFDSLCRVVFDCLTLAPELAMHHVKGLARHCTVPHVDKKLEEKIDSLLHRHRHYFSMKSSAHCVTQLARVIRDKKDSQDHGLESCRVDISPVMCSANVEQELRRYLQRLACLYGGHPSDMIHVDGRCTKKRKVEIQTANTNLIQLEALKWMLTQILTDLHSDSDDEVFQTIFEKEETLNRHVVTSSLGIDDETYKKIWKSVYGFDLYEHKENVNATEERREKWDRFVSKRMDKYPLPKLGFILDRLSRGKDIREVLKHMEDKERQDEQRREEEENDFDSE